MTILYLSLTFIFLTLVRYTFLPVWPLNFIPIAFLIWQNQKNSFIWSLLLLGIFNDLFVTATSFGQTAVIFVVLALFAALISHWGKRSIISFIFLGFLLTLSAGFTYHSLLILPFAILAKLLDNPDTSIKTYHR